MQSENTDQGNSHIPDTIPHLQNSGNKHFEFLMVGIIFLIVGLMLGYLAYPLVNTVNDSQSGTNIDTNVVTPTPTVTEPVATTTAPASRPTEQQAHVIPTDPSFCKKYGSAPIAQKDYLDSYTTGPGDTLRDIARITLDDESKAPEIGAINPQLFTNEVDVEIAMGTIIYIPDPQFQGAENYQIHRVYGNISYNPTKPMFGINGPNTSTGPFIITDEAREMFSGIAPDDCVEVLFGASSNYAEQKPVYKVAKQT